MSTRRANREGTCYQRPSGRWTVEIRWVDRLGRQQRASRSAPTRAEAQRRLRELQQLVATDSSPGERLVTVESYWQRWRRGPLVAQGRKPSTVELYRRLMEVHVIPEIGEVRLSRLTAGDVEVLLAGLTRKRDSPSGLAGEPVSSQTRRMVFAVLSLMLGTAVRDEAVTRNVCADLDRPKVDTAEADYLTPDQLRQVLAAMEGHRLQPLVLLLASTGLRIGEALALRWRDVDLDAARLRVTGTIQHVGGEVRRTAPKSARSRRSLPLSPAVVEALRGWRKVQAAEQLWAGTSWAGGGVAWVFTTATGRALDRRSAARSYERALRSGGVDLPARFHLIRHSVASAMLADGAVSMRTASEILGHASTRMTADTYAHVQDSAKVAALDVVERALGG